MQNFKAFEIKETAQVIGGKGKPEWAGKGKGLEYIQEQLPTIVEEYGDVIAEYQDMLPEVSEVPEQYTAIYEDFLALIP